MTDEKYLGGYSSPELWERAKLFGTKPRGYALYVTNKRIFGARSKKDRFKSVAFEQFIGTRFGTPFGKEEVDKGIAELEKVKEIEISWDAVTAIKMKRPLQASQLLLGAGFGYLQIDTQRGQVLKIYTPLTKDFDALKRLMELFKPEVLNLK